MWSIISLWGPIKNWKFFASVKSNEAKNFNSTWPVTRNGYFNQIIPFLLPPHKILPLPITPYPTSWPSEFTLCELWPHVPAPAQLVSILPLLFVHLYVHMYVLKKKAITAVEAAVESIDVHMSKCRTTYNKSSLTYSIRHYDKTSIHTAWQTKVGITKIYR